MFRARVGAVRIISTELLGKRLNFKRLEIGSATRRGEGWTWLKRDFDWHMLCSARKQHGLDPTAFSFVDFIKVCKAVI